MPDPKPLSAIDRREMQLRGGQASDAADKDMTRATTLPAGKYPKDFTKLYNDFVKGYVQRPNDIAREREAGGGPWTAHMDKLDDIKGTMDWVRGEGKPFAKLPLAAQDYIAGSMDYHEWEVQQPYDRQARTMGRDYGEPTPNPQPNPQSSDIDRLFPYRAWGRNFGPKDQGGAPTPEWKL
jgi:hypothetical protein